MNATNTAASSLVNQFNSAGELTHLLTLEGLPKEQILHILDTAKQFVSVTDPAREVKKVPLEKKTDIVDFNNPIVASFIRFCTKFCFNAGHLQSGKYESTDGKFLIEYLPIICNEQKKELNTPARISKKSGRIQVSMKKFIPMTVPMRMAIMLHEFSHFYINDDINDETEADLNGLLIYLGLGYPRIEAYEAFLTTFIGTPTPTNKERYDIINKFITNFEKNNTIIE